MKKLYVLLLFLVCSAHAQGESEQGCDIVVRFENFARDAKKVDTLSWHGLDVDFAHALLKEAGCDYRFINLPWGRAIKMLETGEVSMMLSMTPTEKRQQFAYFIGPQRLETIVLVTHKLWPYKVNHHQELLLLPAPVAIHKDAFYGEEMARMLSSTPDIENRFIVITDNKLRLSMLKHGRISGFLAEKYNMIYQSENNPDYMHIKVNPFIINQAPVYIALSKYSVSLKNKHRLEQALLRLEKNGTIRRILDKYKLD